LSGRVGKLIPFLYKERTICFMGTSVEEVKLQDLLTEWRWVKKAPSHVLATDDKNSAIIRATAEEHGIRIESFETGRWDALADLAAFLARELDAPSTTVSIGVSRGHADEEYTKQYVSALLLVADENRPSSGFTEALLAEAGMRELVTEQDIASIGRRTVIEGAPGSGKTLLLRRIGELVPASESPVVIALRDVRDTVGTPESLLVDWARLGQSLRDEPQPVGEDALLAERFHFLLDGLDEVPAPNQERVAKALLRIAEVFPQHRFTLTSRRVSVLDLFPQGEWQLLNLQPGPEWRDRFLEAHGTSWVALTDQHPPLKDLVELLRLPFFLRRVLALSQEGNLGELRGLWDVVDRIVSEALARADALPTEPLRKWLRRVAVAMHLAGRASITLDELQGIELSAELKQMGTTREVAETLLGTPLLEGRQPGEYAFVHRLVGEGLVAEELLRIGPVVQVMTVVAPTVSDAISGLRVDWGVPVTLAAAQDADWRAALAGNDPLAAAVATPSSADLDERAEAALLIWRTFSEWETWLFWSEGVDLLEPGEALVRLLGNRDLREMEEALIQGLDSESPFVRVNALQVIGRAEIGDLVSNERLAEFIEHDENVVVRRYAANTAGRLKRPELYGLIASRLEEATDEVERQDLAHAAGRLGTKDQLLLLALMLKSRDRMAAFIVEQALSSELTPEEALTLARAQAEHDLMPLPSDRERLLALAREVEPTDAAAENIAYIALAWTMRDDQINDLLRTHPHGALAGLKRAVEAGAAYEYQTLEFVDLFPIDAWRAAGFSADHLELLNRRREGGRE
jgi:HEAT repeat protein